MHSSPPPPPVIQATDPTLDALNQQAQNANLAALQTQAAGDTAALMARYGTRLAVASALGGGASGTSALTSPLLPSASVAGKAA